MKVFLKGNKDYIVQEGKEVVQKYLRRSQETKRQVLQWCFLEAPSYCF